MPEDTDTVESRANVYGGRHDSNALTLLAIATAFLAAVMIITDVPDILAKGDVDKEESPLNVAAALLSVAVYGTIAWAIRAVVTMEEETRESPDAEKRDLIRRSFSLLILMAVGTGFFMTASAISALLF